MAHNPLAEDTPLLDTAVGETCDGGHGTRPGFAAALIKAVREVLDADYLKAAHRKLHVKALIVGIWNLASYAACLMAATFVQGFLACTSLALAIAAVGFNIQHDANHNAFFATQGSRRLTRANRVAGWSLYALGASQKRWIDGHVHVHHSATNVVGKDSDIEIKPFARLAPQQQHRVWHRWQHVYLWLVYAFTAVSIVVADVVSTVVETFTGDRVGRKPTLGECGVLVVTKSAFFGVMVVVPALVHGWVAVCVGGAWVAMVCGLILGVVFQLAHTVQEASFRATDSDVGARWHEWQIRSSVDFCQDDTLVSRVLTWYVGGLNYQCEHHLFPFVPHTAYPRVATVIRDQAQRFGIPYHVQPTLRAALLSHHRHLRALGRLR